MESTQLPSSIVAVTVYPERARVTRRGRVRLAPGEQTVRIGPLPLGLHRDSVRVSGRGPATVLGVDLLTRRAARSEDALVTELTGQRREVTERLAELADADAVEQQRLAFLDRLAQRAGASYAHALARADGDRPDVAGFADDLAGQLAAARARRRDIARQREEATGERDALDRRLADLAGRDEPDQLVAEVGLVVAEAGGDPAEDIELELTYLVGDAGWKSSYDLRLTGQTLTTTWSGLVTQRTGEDWPACDLRLSTARPAATVSVPELTPWYLDRVRPLPALPVMVGAAPGGPPMPPAAAPMMSAPAGGGGDRHRRAAPVAQSVASVEQGVAAATYRPVRPVAVPADGTAHRTTVAVFEATARLDHVTAPVRAAEAYLRATVVNPSAHTLLPGPAAVFHGNDFVGATRLSTWAPGEELDLALGLDDRVRVERELVRRAAIRPTLGSGRRLEAEYRITVANHTPAPTTVVVLDQLPVSRDEAVTVRELRLDPAPAERTELGELTWRLPLAPGETRSVQLGWRVELAKGVELAGWRE